MISQTLRDAKKSKRYPPTKARREKRKMVEKRTVEAAALSCELLRLASRTRSSASWAGRAMIVSPYTVLL